MNSIDPNSEIALYRQLAQILTSQIKQGILPTGSKIPTEAELMAQYNVSRITVRTALKYMVDDGLLARSQGRGTYVSAPKTVFRADDSIGFTKTCILAGKTPGTVLISSGMEFTSKSVAEFLQISEDTKVLTTQRLHTVDGHPVAIETNHYTPALASIANYDLEKSIFDTLKSKYHISIKHGTRTFTICKANAYEASFLQVKRNSPLLLFQDKILDSNNNPLYYSKQVYCTDAMELYIYV